MRAGQTPPAEWWPWAPAFRGIQACLARARLGGRLELFSDLGSIPAWLPEPLRPAASPRFLAERSRNLHTPASCSHWEQAGLLPRTLAPAVHSAWRGLHLHRGYLFSTFTPVSKCKFWRFPPSTISKCKFWRSGYLGLGPQAALNKYLLTE